MKVLLSIAGIILIFTAVIFIPYLNRGYIQDILLRYPGIDKPIHFIEYSGIFIITYVFLSHRIFGFQKNKKVVIAALFTCVVSLLDESHQRLLPERSFEYADLIVNTVAIAAAVMTLFVKKTKLTYTVCAFSLVIAVVSFITADSYAKMKHFNLGVLSERAKNYKAAMKHYMKAVESGNESPSLYNNMAWINVEFLGGDPRLSLEYAQKALSMAPDDAGILDTYGWALFLLDRPDESLTYLRRAHKIDPEIFCIHYHLGAVYFALGDFELSLQHLKKQYEANPADEYAGKAEAIIRVIKESGLVEELDKAS